MPRANDFPSRDHALPKRPTEVRLEERMMENFKRQVMVAQTMEPK